MVWDREIYYYYRDMAVTIPGFKKCFEVKSKYIYIGLDDHLCEQNHTKWTAVARKKKVLWIHLFEIKT